MKLTTDQGRSPAVQTRVHALFTILVDKVEIHWPSGLVENLTNVSADRYYSVVEAQGIVPAFSARPGSDKHP
jgi:hypothetical protein